MFTVCVSQCAGVQSTLGAVCIRAVENCLIYSMQTLTNGNGTRISRIQGYTRRRQLFMIQVTSWYYWLTSLLFRSDAFDDGVYKIVFNQIWKILWSSPIVCLISLIVSRTSQHSYWWHPVVKHKQHKGSANRQSQLNFL